MRYVSSIRSVSKNVQRNVKGFRAKAVLAVTAAALVVAAASPAFAAPGPQRTTVYDSIPDPVPGNVVSQPFEAAGASEFGGQVKLAGSARTNPTVQVLMSSWACKSGSWVQKNCITNHGSTFSQPVTLNVYGVGNDDQPSGLLATTTKTFDMPYRPTADDGTHCSGSDAGKWWDGHNCNNGKAFTISFDLDDNVTLPDNVILSVAYNTTHFGYHPMGESQACYTTPQGCPYDSLNVGFSPAATVGTPQPTDQDAYLYSVWSGAYCNSATPTAVFQLDQGCYAYNDQPLVPGFTVTATKDTHQHQSGPLGWWHRPNYGNHGSNPGGNGHHKWSYGSQGI